MPYRSRRVASRLLFPLAILLGLILVPLSAYGARNVILMIADGAGYNTWVAGSMYQGKVGKQVYDQPGWVRMACATCPLTLSGKPTGTAEQDRALIYDPAKAWDVTRKDPKLGTFAGYYYLMRGFTDSAAAATALSTGQKSYNSAINWANDDRPLRGKTIAEIAKANGKSVGVVTSVQWSHATPAGLGGAHNRSRDKYAEIANEMLGSTWLDVIMGTGNPDYNDNGEPLPKENRRNFNYVGGESTWAELKAGKRPWTLVQSKAEFEALATGSTPPKVLGTPQVASTLQQRRKREPSSAGARAPGQPFAVPLNENVPSLAVMTRAAVNCLDDSERGFFLMIEGGAVDGANHLNQPDRMVEEQVAFVEAVDAVVAWIAAHGGWDDTLLILTADHECGMVWGPNSAKVAFEGIEDRGAGKLPGMKHHSHGHSNSLVPLYARGPGSQQFQRFAGDGSSGGGNDPKAAEMWHISGQYLDNTAVFAVMQEEMR